MKAIDIDSITTILCEQPEETMTNAEMAEWLEEQDVIEIVRCKECLHRKLTMRTQISKLCEETGIMVWDDDFCSRGIKKNEPL